MYGSNRFKELLDKYINRPLILYGDPDLDGLMSLKLMCEFFDFLGKDYKYFVNEHRYHGFTLPINSLRGYLVVAADFAITEKEMQVLVDNDIAVLSTDHHEIQDVFIDVKGLAEGVVLNNQYIFEPEDNRYLSGAGVFYELACELYPEFKTNDRDAMVGITLLSDIRPTESSKAKKYLKATYSVNTEAGYFKYLIENTITSDYDFGAPKFDRNYIDFTFSPVINALLRFNKTNDAVDFILGKGIDKSLGCRKMQQELVSAMTDRCYKLELPNIAILAVNDTSFLDFKEVMISDFIGLLCSDYKDKHCGKSTLGFVISNGAVVRASFRGKYDDVHYLTGFRHLDIRAEGHANAFGIRDFSPTQDLWVQLNDLIGDLESNHKRTATILPINNLAIALTQHGANMSLNNCYVRDCFRYFFKYEGTNAKIMKITYKRTEFTEEDYLSGVEPDYESKGIKYKNVLDSSGNPIPKYIEYVIDGRKVKSFGVLVEDGLILPILEKGYMQLYVRPMIE